MQTTFKPEVISSVELVARIHDRMLTLTAEAIEKRDLRALQVYNQIDGIILQELKGMLQEATEKIIGSR